jgi:hypothetical protein
MVLFADYNNIDINDFSFLEKTRTTGLIRI